MSSQQQQPLKIESVRTVDGVHAYRWSRGRIVVADPRIVALLVPSAILPGAWPSRQDCFETTPGLAAARAAGYRDTLSQRVTRALGAEPVRLAHGADLPEHAIHPHTWPAASSASLVRPGQAHQHPHGLIDAPCLSPRAPLAAERHDGAGTRESWGEAIPADPHHPFGED